MLKEIRLQNFGFIDQAKLSFDSNMNVVTGETGAGKSMLLSALRYCCGELPAKKWLQKGADKMSVCTIWQVAPQIAKRIAQHLDEVFYDEGCPSTFEVQRVYTKSGSSRQSINGHRCSKAELLTLAQFLLSSTAQNFVHQLSDTERVFGWLDAFAGCEAMADSVRKSFAVLQEQKRFIMNWDRGHHERLFRKDWLEHQVRELGALKLSIEDENIDDRIRSLEQGQRLNAAFAEVVGAIQREGGVVDILTSLHFQVEAALSETDECEGTHALSDGAEQLISQVESAKLQLREIRAHAQKLKEKAPADSDELAALKLRRTQIRDSQRKHRSTLDELIVLSKNLGDELKGLSEGQKQRDDAIESFEDKLHDFLARSVKLHQQREKALPLLNKALNRLCPALDLRQESIQMKLMQPNTNAKVRSATPQLEHYRSKGGPEDDFNAWTPPNAFEGANPFGGGQCLLVYSPAPKSVEHQPVHKIASGGERSRILLAIKVAFAETMPCSLYLFDEIEAGIGGESANALTDMLDTFSAKHQTLLVTHLDRLAARANHHMKVVKKFGRNDEVHAEISTLSSQERIQEIQRMIGGDRNKELSESMARKLLGHQKAA